ncbi:DUF4352 domain-containing protein [Paucilactobacillus suebicus]|uniref:DUF4352 domain-containing protein n=1 Tax=Paucilactobacillus suebicus DSM 5007 = KCTC 3549 TaxID=1423807 RepID=A0A0R1W626_9LACO|nr:DUF4352 domain-containing protein [Paucilactobacillus suebicus]KRM13297.1 hypothetical protein FD16_GL000772 [Paucilactobacillus suebicus DSM 5007 = KCTC 3549]
MSKRIKGEDGNTYVQKKPFYKRVWFWILIVLVLIFAISGINGGDTTSSSSSKSSSSSSSKKTNPLSKVYNVGQTASYKGYEVKVNSVNFSQGDDIDTPDSGKQYVIANVTITNKTDDSQDYNQYDFQLNADGNNTDFDEITSSTDNLLSSGSLDKNASVTGNLVGQASKNSTKLQLQYKTSFWNDKTVKFNLK